MTTITRAPSRRGFTLIELLVVIAIIAVLSTLSTAAYILARDKAKRVTATQTLATLMSASERFYDNYNYPPLSSGETADTVRITDNELMSVLMGLDGTTPRFFTGKRAQGSGSGAFNGVYRTDSEAYLYGPWRLKNEDEKFYRIVYDYNFDGEIKEPEGVGNATIYGHQIGYLLGKDGKAGAGYNQDNIYSYK